MRNKWIYLGLPLLFWIIYVIGMIFFPNPSQRFYKYMFSELGVIENATALFFLMAGILGLVLFFKSCGLAGKFIRIAYILLFFGGVFITLEEVNYGQFYYNYNTGEWFSGGKVEEEINFHKQWGHKPARRMNTIATVGFPMICIVLPIVGIRKGWFNSGHWGFYLLPEKELMLLPVIAQCCSWFDNIYKILDIPMSAWARATEFKELYWGLILLFYGIIIKNRLALLKVAREQNDSGCEVINLDDLRKRESNFRAGA